ncbi:hypothetical protein [Brevibacterium renqingii]|nr:hypothetical protein [Brevibacterium renqingii]
MPFRRALVVLASSPIAGSGKTTSPIVGLAALIPGTGDLESSRQ